MSRVDKHTYYEEKLPALLKQYEAHEGQLAVVLGDYLDPTGTERLLADVRGKVANLLIELPYIGGDSNPLTRMLISSAFALPWFLALEEKGLSMREIAKIWYEVNEALEESRPTEKREQLGEFYFTKEMIDIVKRESEKSQLREYPESWVYRSVDGDEDSFDYGYDILECGILKYYRRHRAERFVPILCLLDYVSYGSLGVGFTRAQKLATGGPLCGFRFKKGLRTPRGWPPEELEEEFPF